MILNAQGQPIHRGFFGVQAADSETARLWAKKIDQEFLESRRPPFEPWIILTDPSTGRDETFVRFTFADELP